MTRTTSVSTSTNADDEGHPLRELRRGSRVQAMSPVTPASMPGTAPSVPGTIRRAARRATRRGLCGVVVGRSARSITATSPSRAYSASAGVRRPRRTVVAVQPRVELGERGVDGGAVRAARRAPTTTTTSWLRPSAGNASTSRPYVCDRRLVLRAGRRSRGRQRHAQRGRRQGDQERAAPSVKRDRRPGAAPAAAPPARTGGCRRDDCKPPDQRDARAVDPAAEDRTAAPGAR